MCIVIAMRLYVDTVDPREIDEAMGSGVVYGVTSNPFLYAERGVESLRSLVEELEPHVRNELHVQVPGRRNSELVDNALMVYEVNPRKIVVKIPAIAEGFKAMRQLKERGVRVTATAVTTASQAILASLVGADYVAPYVGRVDEAGYGGMELLRTIIEIYRAQRTDTMILAASMRSPGQVVEAYRLGADAVTVKYSMFRRLMESQLTEAIMRQVDDIWRGIRL